LLQLGERPRTAFLEGLSYFGERHGAGVPVHKPHAELRLQLTDLGAQRGLGEVQSPRCPQVQLLGHGQK
jgi:hypothetical protein